MTEDVLDGGGGNGHDDVWLKEDKQNKYRAAVRTEITVLLEVAPSKIDVAKHCGSSLLHCKKLARTTCHTRGVFASNGSVSLLQNAESDALVSAVKCNSGIQYTSRGFLHGFRAASDTCYVKLISKLTGYSSDTRHTIPFKILLYGTVYGNEIIK